MLHTLVYFNSAVGVNQVDFDLAAVATEQVFTISNSHYIPTVPCRIVGAYVVGVSVVRGKFQTPRLRATFNPSVVPVERSLTVPNRPLWNDLTQMPLKLNAIDELSFLISNNLGAATEPEIAAVWIDDGNTAHTQGEVFTLRATTAATFTSQVWSSGAMTFEQVLPAGRYAIVGAHAGGANGFVGRFIFPGQTWRPGFVVTNALGQYAGREFRRGYLGDFGQFDSVAQPLIEMFPSGALATPDIFLDLIRVR